MVKLESSDDGDPSSSFSLSSLGRTNPNDKWLFKKAKEIDKEKVSNDQNELSTIKENLKPPPSPLTPCNVSCDPSATVRSPYAPPTKEELERYKFKGPQRSGHSNRLDKLLAPIQEQQQEETESSLTSDQHVFTDKAKVASKLQDYSLRSLMVTERIRFEILLESADSDIDFRTKALVILGKLCNIDPSRKLMPYQDTELSDYPS
jgi:hypothetical protein